MGRGKVLAVVLAVVMLVAWSGLASAAALSTSGWSATPAGLIDGTFNVSAQVLNPGGYVSATHAAVSVVPPVYVNARMQSVGTTGTVTVELVDSGNVVLKSESHSYDSNWSTLAFNLGGVSVANVTMIRVRNEATSGGPAEVAEIGFDPSPIPNSPVPVVSGVTSSGADVSWSAVQSATGYKVQVGAAAAVDVGNVLAYALTGLAATTNYTVYVSAYSGAGESGQGSAAFATLAPPDTTPPSVPSGVTVVGGNRSIAVSWSSVVDAASYGVYVDGVKTVTVDGALTTATVSALLDGTAYSIQVSATDLAGNESALSTVVVATTDAASVVPGAVTGLKASGFGDYAFLAWDATPGATSYDVTVAGAVYSASTNGFRADGLTPNTSYDVTVGAVNSVGPGPAAALTFNSGAAPPGSLADLTARMVGVFGQAKLVGVAVVGGAIGLALVFLAARFAFGLLRRWLAKAG